MWGRLAEAKFLCLISNYMPIVLSSAFASVPLFWSTFNEDLVFNFKALSNLRYAFIVDIFTGENWKKPIKKSVLNGKTLKLAHPVEIRRNVWLKIPVLTFSNLEGRNLNLGPLTTLIQTARRCTRTSNEDPLDPSVGWKLGLGNYIWHEA